MRTTRIRQKVKKYLMTHGEVATTKIYDHVNETMTWGVTMQQLGNVLSKDKDIEQISEVRKGGAISGGYTVMTWDLTPQYRKMNAEFEKADLKETILAWLEQAGPGEYVAKDIRKGLGGHHAFSSNVFKRVADDGPDWLDIKRHGSRKTLIYCVSPRS